MEGVGERLGGRDSENGQGLSSQLSVVKRIVDIFVSFWQLSWRVIFRRKRQVLFYYPQHFNRSARGSNPFFDHLLETCDCHGISYHLIEEPDWDTDKPRNNKAIKGDAFFVVVTALRKTVGLFCHKGFWDNEQKVAVIINFLTLGRLRYRTYITISGSMLHLFGYLNNKGIVYDVQHGILYKRHPTFFDEHQKLRSQYYQKNLHWLFWGRGYERCFNKGEEFLLKDRTHVTGYPMSPDCIGFDGLASGGIVLFSLQFTHQKDSASLAIFEKQKSVFEQSLSELKGAGVRVLLKQHPRYNNDIYIDDWFDKYDFVELTTLSVDELLPLVFLQVTINSTTAFEYAEYGIPSVFIDPNGILPDGDLFYTEYQYPLYRQMTLLQVVKRLQNAEQYQEDSRTVKEWYRSFYDDYNEQAFLRIIS